MRSIAERFWQKVRIGAEADCWDWTAYKNTKGYGRIRETTGLVLAHRVSFELAFGPIPAGMLIDHICSNPSCVNPAHLRLATVHENARNQRRKATNSSGLKGATWNKDHQRWSSQICVNSRLIHLGFFDTPQLAHAAYCEAAKRYHGQFANFGIAQ